MAYGIINQLYISGQSESKDKDYTAAKAKGVTLLWKTITISIENKGTTSKDWAAQHHESQR
jgi:hypothetical protein